MCIEKAGLSSLCSARLPRHVPIVAFKHMPLPHPSPFPMMEVERGQTFGGDLCPFYRGRHFAAACLPFACRKTPACLLTARMEAGRHGRQWQAGSLAQAWVGAGQGVGWDGRGLEEDCLPCALACLPGLACLPCAVVLFQCHSDIPPQHSLSVPIYKTFYLYI